MGKPGQSHRSRGDTRVGGGLRQWLMSRHYKRIPICQPPIEPHLRGQVNSPAHGLSSGVADGGSGFLLAQFHALDSASLKKGR